MLAINFCKYLHPLAGLLFATTNAFAAAPAMPLQPFHLKLPHSLTAAQAKAELMRPRDLRAGAEAPTNLPKHAPSSCAQLLQRWDNWSVKGRTDKWMEMAYNLAMLDCLTLKHLANAKPASRTVEQVLAEMGKGTQLSGDFYPDISHPVADYQHLLRPADKDVPNSLQISLKNGDSGQIYKTYYIMAGGVGPIGEEWYAVEHVESGTATFADCGFVVIDHGFTTAFTIRDRLYLGRCG